MTSTQASPSYTDTLGKHIRWQILLVLLGFMESLRLDLMGYLFGDILAIDRADLAWIWGGGALVLASRLLEIEPDQGVRATSDLQRVVATHDAVVGPEMRCRDDPNRAAIIGVTMAVYRPYWGGSPAVI